MSSLAFILLLGARKKLTVTAGETVLATQYDYDDAGRLQTVTDPKGGIYTTTYDDANNRQTLSYPNGAVTTYSVDNLNRLTQISTMANGAPLQLHAYTLRVDGLRTAVDEVDGTHRQYEYDNLKRLTNEMVQQNGMVVYENGFTYDSASNRLTQTHTSAGGATTTTYAYDSRDRLLSEDGRAYSWDANGNMLGHDGTGGSSMVWDFEDRLVKVTMAGGTVVEHVYDVSGNRVRTKVTPVEGAPETTDFVLDNAGPLSQVVADVQNGELTVYYIRARDLLAALRGDTSTYVHADGIGSTRILTDSLVAATDAYRYTAFGELTAHSGSDSQPFRFAGEAWDATSHLAYHRARWMDVTVGRFLSQDPQARSVRPGIIVDNYLYASASPVDRIDPTGHFGVEVGVTIAAMVTLITAEGCHHNPMRWHDLSGSEKKIVEAAEADASGLIARAIARLEASDDDDSLAFGFWGEPWHRGEVIANYAEISNAVAQGQMSYKVDRNGDCHALACHWPDDNYKPPYVISVSNDFLLEPMTFDPLVSRGNMLLHEFAHAVLHIDGDLLGGGGNYPSPDGYVDLIGQYYGTDIALENAGSYGWFGAMAGLTVSW